VVAALKYHHHDLAVCGAGPSDHIMVLQQGAMVEYGNLLIMIIQRPQGRVYAGAVSVRSIRQHERETPTDNPCPAAWKNVTGALIPGTDSTCKKINVDVHPARHWQVVGNPAR